MGENKYPIEPVSFDLKYGLPLDTSHIFHLNETPEIYFTPFKDLPKCQQFASAVLMFGSLLRKSKFVKDVSWNDALQIASASAASDNYSQKEFVSLVQIAKSIYSKKTRKGKSKS
jgi:Ca-activated chloride channel family protein